MFVHGVAHAALLGGEACAHARRPARRALCRRAAAAAPDRPASVSTGQLNQRPGCRQVPGSAAVVVGGLLERGGDRLIGVDRRRGAVPCGAMDVALRPKRVAQRGVGTPVLRRARRDERRLAQQRMAELRAAGAQLEHCGAFGLLPGFGVDPEGFPRSHEGVELGWRVQRGKQRGGRCRRRERLQPVTEQPLDQPSGGCLEPRQDRRLLVALRGQ